VVPRLAEAGSGPAGLDIYLDGFANKEEQVLLAAAWLCFVITWLELTEEDFECGFFI